jgi:tRNA1(Val) A37 N6-methylase TrmN6
MEDYYLVKKTRLKLLKLEISSLIAVHSPAGHTAFQIARNCAFLKKLRHLQKPVGFKICIGRQDEFIDIIKAMKETELKPILLQLTEQRWNWSSTFRIY